MVTHNNPHHWLQTDIVQIQKFSKSLFQRYNNERTNNISDKIDIPLS